MDTILGRVDVTVTPVCVWADKKDGVVTVWRQHEGGEPFAYAVLNYDYRHTSNAGQCRMAQIILDAMGGGENRA